MPRISSEARGAASFRAGGRAPQPPRHLRGRARAIWRETVLAKPADYFDPANQGLLARLCTLSAYCEGLEGKLAATPSAVIADELRKTAAVVGVLAVRLRLTVQATVDRKSGVLNEKGPGRLLHLIGGNTVNRKDEGA